METRIIFTLKENQGNLRGLEEKAHLEKSQHPINLFSKESNKEQLCGFVGEPDIRNEEISFQLTNESSRNILIASENEAISFRIAISILLTLYKQSPDSKFYAFNSLSSYHDQSAYLDNIRDLIGLNIPKTEIEKNEVLISLKNEIDNRIKNKIFNDRKIFLTILSYQQAYEFRKVDYGDSKEGELLKYILKEGTQVGVFVILQVDSLTSLRKNSFDLDEFSIRLIGKIDLISSANFLENRNTFFGSKDSFELEENRAIFYDCKKNKMTKFIPYELPNISWVHSLITNNSLLT